MPVDYPLNEYEINLFLTDDFWNRSSLGIYCGSEETETETETRVYI